ncbi:hypothetical protein KR084_012762, partial [Drosophila pseudotakahashii]
MEVALTLAKIQITDLQKSLAGLKSVLDPTFEKIGSRYFLFEHFNNRNWTEAKMMCRYKGAHLAAIKDDYELNEISSKLFGDTFYWLGLNKSDNQSHFTSVASGKLPSYLPMENQSFTNHEECISLNGDYMEKQNCDNKFSFICQK